MEKPMSFLNHLKSTFENFGHELADDSSQAKTQVLDAVRAKLGELQTEVEDFFQELKGSVVSQPEIAFSLLRTLQPILVTKGFALVTRFDDVQEVLSRDEAFDPPYATKMRRITDGENFFLGMRDTARYTRDVSNMRLAVRRDDLASVVSPFVEARANQIVAEAGGSIEFVTELARPVPAQLVGQYFGTPGPSEEELIDWASTLFQFLFLDQANDLALEERALVASKRLNAYLDQAIDERKSAPKKDGDDVLARCLAMQAAGLPGTRDLDIRNNLMGLIVGAIPTTATAAALALDVLLDRPSELKGARAAALDNDDALLTRYVLEALRFKPMNPGIFRIAREDYRVARGKLRSTEIPKGTTVVAATQSAMFDGSELDNPRSFRLDRPPYHYMHWGHGLHGCFGAYINQVQIPLILKAVLRQPELRRADGEAGRLHKEGAFANSMRVQWG
jgi:cytochrome P450